VPNIPPVDQDYKLLGLLNQIQTLLINARDMECGEYCTTAMQAAVLFVVNAVGEETTPTEISRWLLRKPATVSGLLDRMEKAGLVERVKDLPKKNMVRIRLTENGKQVYKKSLKRGSLHKTMSCLSEKESQQLTSTLVKLRKRATEVLGHKQKIPFPETSETPGQNR